MKLGLFFAAGAVSLVSCGGRQEPAPHIFLITADALRADHLSAHGYHRQTSPRLDRFAAGASWFLDAITVIPKTGPSFTTMFTGRHPEEHGVRHNGTRASSRLPLLAERLLSAGYRTAAFVSNPVLSAASFSRGFETFETFGPEDGTALVNRRFLEWAERDWSEPTFVWLHYIDPHGPYAPPEEYEALFIDDEWAGSDRRIEVSPRLNKILGAIPKYQARDGETRVDRYIALYDAEIRHVDASFGEIVDFLRERGLYDGGVVIFTSDHGESLGEHNFYFEHGWYAYEPTLGVPLMIKAPGQHEGRTVSDPVSNLDFLPTLLNLAGLPPDDAANGADVLGPLPRRGAVVVESSDNYPEKYFGLRSAQWKYLFRRSDRRKELYDLRADPGETRNLASADPERLEDFQRVCMDELKRLRANRIAPATIEKLRGVGYVD